MILGNVTAAGVPIVLLEMAGRRWEAVIDTGFNGDLELPDELKSSLPCRYVGQVTSLLAAGQRIVEDAFQVEVPFDGQTLQTEATFVSGQEILVGTRLLRSHRLEIDFPIRTISLQRS